MKHPVVTITTEDGGVVRLEFYPEVIPGTVNNSLSLTKKGFYDGFVFHRVIEGFTVQGSCPIDNDEGGPGYVIKGEFKQNGMQSDLKHKRGVTSVARTSVPDSAGGQFFIMYKAVPHPDGGYTALSKLIEGGDVLDRIATTKTSAMDKPLKDQKIKTVTVEIFGEIHPELKKLPEVEY